MMEQETVEEISQEASIEGAYTRAIQNANMLYNSVNIFFHGGVPEEIFIDFVTVLNSFDDADQVPNAFTILTSVAKVHGYKYDKTHAIFVKKRTWRDWFFGRR